MAYNGYKLLDKISLVCREPSKNEEYYQAYLVDPSNKKQLEAAKRWAHWVEYGPYDSQKKEYEYKFEHNPVTFYFDNTKFQFELHNCAGGSSQGGKLSFWNCLIKKDDKTFMIGINSDMLLDVLKEGTFVKGICQESVCFATKTSRCGVVVEGKETWQLAKGDMNLKSSIANSLTTKYKSGDNVITTVNNDVFIAKLYRYYTFEDSASRYYFNHRGDRYETCTLTKLKKPQPVYIFSDRHLTVGEDKHIATKLSEFLDTEKHWRFNLTKTAPRRAIGEEPVTVDISEEEIANIIYANHSVYNDSAICESYGCDNKMYGVYRFLYTRFFGISDKPFELDNELVDLLKKNYVKVVEE